MKEIYLAGGCFWGLQKFFDQFDGVAFTEAGYANGPESPDGCPPRYEDVCRSSGHAETVRVAYDENILSLTGLLRYYFMVIDPVSVNRQGNDRGIQYRTGIYYTEMGQLREIRPVYEEEQGKAGRPLAVELEPLKNFYPAEEYHQKYLEKNPGGYCHIPAKYYRLAEQEKTAGFAGQGETTEELRARIGETAFEVTQHAATERPFTGRYDTFFEKGIYVDVVSGEPLFSSLDKFDSGCGWPAFSKPLSAYALEAREDRSHGMYRIEVRSSRAGSHLGHVFDDGPRETGGLRFCINSAALRFIPYDELDKQGYGEYKALFPQ